MWNKVSDRITEFRALEKSLIDLLSGKSDPPGEKVRMLDAQLSRAFSIVLGAKLYDPSDILDRVHFLVAQARQLSDANGIVAEMLQTIVADADLLANLDGFNGTDRKAREEYRQTDIEMTELCYRSRLSAPLSSRELNSICAEACRKNTKTNVTGILTYDTSSGSISQILEGPTPVVNDLIETISNDSRHMDVEIEHKRTIEKRVFEHWAMFLVTSAEVRVEIDRVEEIDTWIEHRLAIETRFNANKSLQFLSESVRAMCC